MPRSDRIARPVRRRLLAPIASLTAAAGIATVLIAVIGPATPAAAAVSPERTRGVPTLPIANSSSGAGASSPAVHTSAPVVSYTSQHSTNGSNTHTAGSRVKYSSTFTPQTLTSRAPATSASACVADTTAPAGGADLELPQVPGDSTDPGYDGWLRVGSVGPNTMLPPQLDASNLSTLTLTRTVDAQSANLAMAASSGDRFACARLDVAAGQGYQRIDYALTNAGFISEYQKGKTEYLTITYAQISWNYQPTGGNAQTGAGSVSTKPDQAQASVRRDAKLVGAGVVGLTLLCALGMLTLTLVGRHRRKVRYRQVRERSRRIPSPVPSAAGLRALPRQGAPVPQLAQARAAVAEPVLALAQAPSAASAGSLELPVPEELRTVKVTQFAHTRVAFPEIELSEEVELPESESPEIDLPEAELPEAELPETELPETESPETEPSAPEPDAAADGPGPDGEVDADPVDLPDSGGQDEPGELPAEVDPDGEPEADRSGGEELAEAEAGLAPDDEQDAEIGGGAGEQGDQPGDGEGEPGGGPAAGDQLAAEPEQDAGDGDGDGLGEPGLAEPGVADPGEGGAEDGVAEDVPADLQDDGEGEPEDGGGEGLEVGPGGDDEGVGRVEVDAEGDPGPQHDADSADDADDDEQDLEQPGGGGDVEAGEAVLDGGDQGAAGEQGEQAAGDDGRGQDGGVDEV